MEKKEFPKIEGNFKPQPRVFSGISEKLSGLSNKVFGFSKFVLGVSLLPLIYSSTTSFLDGFSLVDKGIQVNFWSGIASFLIIYLFVWEPVLIYAKGQKLLEICFNFFKPLVRVAPYLLPIYLILLFLLYGLLSLFIKSEWLIKYSVFLFGFTFSLHLVFSAKSVRLRKGDFLKANYVFGFSFIYILNVMLLAFFINLIFEEFSFVGFCSNSFSAAGTIFYAVFKQLFLR